jgi:predicted NBD/HSP70 family sugar kinase
MTLPRWRAAADAEARSAPHLRRLNRERILAVALDRVEPFTRAQLTQATGLSAPTVGDLAGELIRAGLLRDLGTGPSRGGRRPSFMQLDARYGFTIAIALGTTRTQLALADLRGERVAHRVLPTPAGAGPTRVLAQLAAWARTLLKDSGVARDKLLAVGVGVPGAVDFERGTVVALTPNLRGWSSVPVAELLGRSLEAPVVVENDVNLAVLGEHWRGAAHGHDTCAFIHVGTGIGAGILVEGHVHRGHHFQAGEIGLTCLGPQYIETDFGSRGCLETLAGMRALLARWNGAGKESATALLEAAAAGDRAARRAIGEAATLIGIATANLSLALDPSLVVLGGALTAQEECFVSELRRVVGRIIPRPPQIVVSGLGREATLWGGVLVATTEARRVVRARLRASSVG